MNIPSASFLEVCVTNYLTTAINKKIFWFAG